jgi:hypothetical protein
MLIVMTKTLLVIFIFILVIIFISIAFSLFFTPKIRYEDCVLLQSPDKTQVDCFGCFNNHCKDAESNWQIYIPHEGDPIYACQKTAQGCQLTRH